MTNHYEVLSPWAEVDPIPLRGISSRLPQLSDQTIGLFLNPKQPAGPILNLVEQNLRERFPSLKFSQYYFKYNREVTETDEQAKFEEWLSGVDAVITAIGD